MKKKKIFNTAIAATMFSLTLTGMSPAFAINAGSKNGDHTNGCSVAWDAASVMNTALTDNDPVYPHLMTGLDGKPISGGGNAYTNGGYITEIRPEYNDAGILEINHFYGNSTNGVWRIPIATDYTIDNTKIIVTIPSENLTPTFDPISVNSTIGNWGSVYSHYQWNSFPQASFTKIADNKFEINFGTLPAHTGTVFQINFTLQEGTPLDQYFVSTASLTGNYREGGGCKKSIPVEETPTPTPTATNTPTPTTQTSNTPTVITPSATPSVKSMPTAITTPVNTPQETPINIPATNVSTETNSRPTNTITPETIETKADYQQHPKLSKTGGNG